MGRTLQSEDRIAHYRVVGPLGAGGMGEVYVVQDEKLERSVALKVLPPDLVRNEERVRRFITEAKSASSLNHPNIVTVHEIGHERVRPSDPGDGVATEPVHYIAMELVKGETLDQRIHDGRTDLRTLMGYMAQAAEGIAKAHAAGIVHRDLKPGNIMISKDGFAKVLDFGLAKLVERQGASGVDLASAPTAGAATGNGVVMGTVGYMSPEQVQARPADHRSDIFSMGCILYEAAARRRPFVADTDVEVLHQILKQQPPPIEELNPEVPTALRRLIRRCLAKNPDQRLQSMKDLAIELREIVEEWASLNVTSTPSGSGSVQALDVPPAPRRGSWAVVLAAIAIGIAGLAFGIYRWIGPAAPTEGAATRFQEMQISILMSRNDLNEATLSADGRYLAYVTGSDRTTSLRVRQVRTGGDVVILADSEVQIRGIRFSPDGDYLYFLNRDPDLPNYSALFQVPSLGGTPRKVFFDVDTAATFSPDGAQVCFRRGLPDRGADSLVIGVLQTGEERELIRIDYPERFQADPAWSPDGSEVAISVLRTAGGLRNRVVAVDVATGAIATIGAKAWLEVNSLGWTPDGDALMISGVELGVPTAPQIHRLSYPDGQAVRTTNDLDGYGNISLSANGESLAAVRRSTVSNLWVASLEGDVAPITFASGSSASVDRVVPLPGGAVAFTSPKDNKVFLWRMEADGSGRRQLTTEGIFVVDAAWAEEAGIVFTQIEAGEDFVGHVWRIGPDGTGLRQLTRGSGEQVRHLSPTGNAVLFNKWDDPQAVWVVKLDGSEPYQLSSNGVDPKFAPDGQRVLLSRLEGKTGELFPHHYVLPLDGGAPLASFRLPPGAGSLWWTPDGKAVTYVDRDRGWNLMRKRLPDGEPEPLTRFTEGQIVDHDWHPDGSRMVFHRRVGQQHSLWSLEPGRAEATPIADFKTGATRRHHWAPDGPRLYFTYSTFTQDMVLITDFG